MQCPFDYRGWSTSLVRSIATLFATAAAVLGGLAVGITQAAAAPTNHIGYQGHAFGSRITGGVAGAVNFNSGRSALSVLGCTIKPGRDNENATAKVTFPGGAGSVSGIADKSTSAFANNVATSMSTSSTGAVNLMGGVITAQAIQTSATASEQENGSSPQATMSSQFVGLSVAGHSQGGSPPANTTIPLPGIGSVVLNAQHSAKGNGLAIWGRAQAMVVNVSVSNNPTGLPVGAKIVVAESFAGLTKAVAGVLGRVAYGTALVKAGLASGPSFPAYLSCFGTGGKTQHNTGASVSAGPFSTANVDNTDEGVDHVGTPLEANLSSTVNSVTLGAVPGLPVGNILSATVVKSVASSTTTNGQTSMNENGSEIVGLKVAGQSVTPGTLPPKNTQVPIPNVGTLWLNRVIVSGRQIEVRMMELDISNSNLAAAIGTPDLRVAVAIAKS